MKSTQYLVGLLIAAALGVAACAGPVRTTETYPTPMPLDLPVGIDEGLITPGWDGGYPLRLLAFVLHPVGVGADLLVSQPFYLLASQAPEVFGYTVQDEIYRDTVLKYRYHWRAPERR
jgi:hypothetical protein